MKLRTIRYYIREAFRSIIVNRLMSVASIFAVSSSIFIVAVFYILGANVEHMVGQLEQNIGIVAFIDDNATPEEIQGIQSQINSNTNVRNVYFHSREDELESIRSWFDNEVLLAGFELNNPFSDSFIIELWNLAFQEDVVRAVEGIPGITSIQQSADIAGALVTMRYVVQLISAVLVFVLGLISITIIINTIRITVNSRKTEINIMKYVGATDWFIRWPFVLEGVIIGLIGGAIPAGLVWFGYSSLIEAVSGIPELGFIEFLQEEAIFIYVLPNALILGGVIGLIGSAVSVRKHLKV